MTSRDWICAGLVLLVASAAIAEPPKGHKNLGDLDCGDCHSTAGWGTTSGGKGFDHARTGFPLSGAHAATACGGCHTAERAITRACAGCHADPHEARLGVACDVCHGAVSFRDTVAREAHARTRLPLSGMHALLDCTACHVRGSGRMWSDAPADCIGCHDGDYRRPGLHPVHDGSGGAAPFPRRCETCHRTVAWSPALFSPTVVTLALGGDARRKHDRAFPISFGRHRAAACADCHVAGEAAPLVACTGCHAHAPARLAARHRQGGPPTEGSCLTCHPRGTR